MKDRIRIINAHAFLMVDPATLHGKYREDRPHYEAHDGKTWALIVDMDRLRIGNRNEA